MRLQAEAPASCLLVWGEPATAGGVWGEPATAGGRTSRGTPNSAGTGEAEPAEERTDVGNANGPVMGCAAETSLGNLVSSATAGGTGLVCCPTPETDSKLLSRLTCKQTYFEPQSPVLTDGVRR